MGAAAVASIESLTAARQSTMAAVEESVAMLVLVVH